MLHILTIGSRFHLLPKIWESIKEYKDVTWHIAKSVFREDIEKFTDDSRVKIYELSCEDIDTGFKMNSLFREIKDLGGYFCVLDDDSVFHANMYYTYEEYIDSKIGMVIGNQEDKEGRTRIHGSYPRACAIDSGNVLCHTSVLEYVEWSVNHWSKIKFVDFEFWDACFKHFGLKYTDVIQETISVYNKLSEVKDSLDYVRE